MTTKQADLLPTTKLQPHQQKIHDMAKEGPVRLMMMHALGSGKTLTSLAAAEAAQKPYTAVVPASLRENFKKEQNLFTDMKTPSQVMSYTGVARGDPVNNLGTLIFDEAHRLRNPRSKQTINAQEAANQARNLVLLTGTPIVNEPGDVAPLMSMLRRQSITPEEFTGRYVQERQVQPGLIGRLRGITPGVERDIANEDELKSMLKGHVDYYAPSKPTVPTQFEDHDVEMTPEQTRIYHAMFDKLPWVVRWKLKHDYPLSRDEFLRMQSFMVGPRQVGLSTYPFLRYKNPHRAFNESAKLQKAMGLLQDKLQDPRTKALVFSNFIDAGLTPYSAALSKAGIPNAMFHGGLSDAQRKKLVDDYNANKIRVALLGPSGAEGLSFKGTQLIQQLDPYWHNVRTRQQQGRGLRFDSHTDIPEDLRNVTVQRFAAKLPLATRDRLLSSIGFNRDFSRVAADDILKNMAARKDKLNQQFVNLLQEVGSTPYRPARAQAAKPTAKPGEPAPEEPLPEEGVQQPRRQQQNVLQRLYSLLFGDRQTKGPPPMQLKAAEEGPLQVETSYSQILNRPFRYAVLSGEDDPRPIPEGVDDVGLYLPQGQKPKNPAFQPWHEVEDGQVYWYKPVSEDVKRYVAGALKTAEEHNDKPSDLLPWTAGGVTALLAALAIRKAMKPVSESMPGTQIWVPPYAVPDQVPDPKKMWKADKAQQIKIGAMSEMPGLEVQKPVPTITLDAPPGYEAGPTRPDSKGIIAQLHEIKKHSDQKNWLAKHTKLRNLMEDQPFQWELLEDPNMPRSIVGVRHWPTGFQFHMPRAVVPSTLYMDVKARQKPALRVGPDAPET